LDGRADSASAKFARNENTSEFLARPPAVCNDVPMEIFMKNKRGFSLVEILVAVAIFLILGMAIYACFGALMRVSKKNNARILALAAANEQIEIIRNLPYDSIGVGGGIPSGILPSSQIINKSGIDFTINYTVRNIDDPFDGTIGGVPNDTSPADYKKVELRITCANCPQNPPIIISANIARRGLEMSSGNGALFIQVLDASGQPVPQATVSITNNLVVPNISLTDLTDNNGMLQVVDVPPSNEGYHITVGKTGYTQAVTLPRDPVNNPNPLDIDLTVGVQQLTLKTLFIDLISSLSIQALNQACVSLSGVEIGLTGSKLIGTSPDILKYSQDLTTGAGGLLNLSGMEWDAYRVQINSAGYDLAGIIPLLPINLLPGSDQNYRFILAGNSLNNLLVTVKDNASGVLLSGAGVRLYKSDLSYDRTETTGRGYILQTDWSGGAGQADFVDPARYFSGDGNIDIDSSPGNISLKQTAGFYAGSGEIISSAFDAGEGSNFVSIKWESVSQPPETGLDSVKFQIATNNDNATWNFVGPDGTNSTYFTAGNSDIAGHNNKRYFRYKILLSTANNIFTPLISNIIVGFTESCAPPGQLFFSSLASGEYNIEVNLAGYQLYSDVVNVSGSSQKEILLIP
jgi:prepilin-type N-terminal cleavage/methylation domain-containing protein